MAIIKGQRLVTVFAQNLGQAVRDAGLIVNDQNTLAVSLYLGRFELRLAFEN